MNNNNKQHRVASFADSLDRPLLLTKGTTIVLFDPQFHAAVVERVIAFSPNDNALLLLLVAPVLGLTPQTGIYTKERQVPLLQVQVQQYRDHIA